MMISRQALDHHCHDLLNVDAHKDYCPNGLQVQGADSIQTIAVAVTASLDVIEQAIAAGVQALITHHGYFWRGEAQPITAMKAARIQALLQHQINLFTYHLPLDTHVTLGNNAQLAQRLGLTVTEQISFDGVDNLIWKGQLSEALSANDFATVVEQSLDRKPLLISAGDQAIQSVAWCTGAAQGFAEYAADWGVDAYLTGEASEKNYHIARESGVHFIAAGHHASERYGVQALADHLAKEFALETVFIDSDNPI